MIDGVTSDLEPTSNRDLRRAISVLLSGGLGGRPDRHSHLRISLARALLLAEKCGVAFQLTNILRDVREDAELGRIYLPAEDLRQFGVTPEQLRSGTENDAFRSLMRFEGNRARNYYVESEPLSDLIDKKSRASLWALRAIYLRLLKNLERSNYSVLSKRINVPTRTKFALLLRAFLR